MPTRACVFVQESELRRAWALGAAIRSVSHLGLARSEPMSSLPNFRTERSGLDVSGPAPSGSVFLVTGSITRRVGLGKRAQIRHPTRCPPRILSGPENLQCRAAFIQFQRALVPRKPF